MSIQQYIEFYFPGAFVSETEVHPVASRNAPVVMPLGAYAYRFFARQEAEMNGEILRGKAHDHSPMTYFGKALTLDEVKALDGDYRILISNMECNRWNRVVRTVRGNFQPLLDGDVVLSPPALNTDGGSNADQT
jgi:hypothetical protein